MAGLGSEWIAMGRVEELLRSVPREKGSPWRQFPLTAISA